MRISDWSSDVCSSDLAQAFATISAGVARPARIDGHPGPGNQMGNAVADLLDRSRDLVAEDHGLSQPHGAEAAVMIVVEIGAADAAGPDPDPHLARSGGGGVDSLDAQILRSVNEIGRASCRERVCQYV